MGTEPPTHLVQFPTATLILPAEADRPTWLAARTLGIGGSDVACLKGESRYGTAFQVWEDKTGRATEQEQTKVMRRGQLHEWPTAVEYSEDFGVEVFHGPGLLRSIQFPHVQATPDAIILTKDGVVEGLEIKYVEGWQIAKQLLRGQMPASWYWQILTYLLVTGLDTWHLAASIRGESELWVRTYYRADVEQTLDALGPFIEDWWSTHVEMGIPPADGGAVYEPVEPEDVEDVEAWVPEQLLRDEIRMRDISKLSKELTAESDEIKARWLEEVGGYKYVCANGRRIVQKVNSKKPYIKFIGED